MADKKIKSPKKGQDALYIACLNVAKNLLNADMLNKEYVSYRTLADAMLANSTVAVRRLLTKLGYDKAPYVNALSDEERAEVLYENLKVFQLAGLKDYANNLKTKKGKEKARARLVRGKFPDGYNTKKKQEKAKEESEKLAKLQQVQNDFDDFNE